MTSVSQNPETVSSFEEQKAPEQQGAGAEHPHVHTAAPEEILHEFQKLSRRAQGLLMSSVLALASLALPWFSLFSTVSGTKTLTQQLNGLQGNFQFAGVMMALLLFGVLLLTIGEITHKLTGVLAEKKEIVAKLLLSHSSIIVLVVFGIYSNLATTMTSYQSMAQIDFGLYLLFLCHIGALISSFLPSVSPVTQPVSTTNPEDTDPTARPEQFERARFHGNDA